MEQEQDSRINLLDITTQRTGIHLTHSIYQKATAAGTVIHNISCHPIQHKMSEFNYMKNRLHIYSMGKEKKKGRNERHKIRKSTN
jgi:hypothetical protein